MKQIYRFNVYLVFLLLLLSSCNKRQDVAVGDLELVGTWYFKNSNKTIEINMESNGMGYTNSKVGITTEEYKGKFRIIDEQIVFKVLGKEKIHKIEKRPYTGKLNGIDRTLMDIDGEVFYKK